jgi:hypothetical protein
MSRLGSRVGGSSCTIVSLTTALISSGFRINVVSSILHLVHVLVSCQHWYTTSVGSISALVNRASFPSAAHLATYNPAHRRGLNAEMLRSLTSLRPH